MQLSDMSLMISEIDKGEGGTPLENVDKAIDECEARLRALRAIRRAFIEAEKPEQKPKAARGGKKKTAGEAVSA